jgi:hypothetical protein
MGLRVLYDKKIVEIKNTYFTAVFYSGAKGTFRHFGVVSYVLVFT